MAHQEENFISLSIREFQKLKSLSDRAVEQVSEESFFARESKGDNSIAQIYKHVSGNLKSRWTDFLTSDGEKPDRDRDSEFTIREKDSHHALVENWNHAWGILFGSLEPLSQEDLVRTVTIRGESLTVLQAICRQLTHYAYHVGQIVYLAKHYAGDDWQSLSIPVGKSKDFNEKPRSYLSDLEST